MDDFLPRDQIKVGFKAKLLPPIKEGAIKNSSEKIVVSIEFVTYLKHFEMLESKMQ